MSHSQPCKRADASVVAQGLCQTRSQARQIIESGSILWDGKPIDKPSRKVPTDAQLELTQALRFVSRAGEKLDAALNVFEVAAKGLNALDIGASTGGFTDCLLQRHAQHVTCIDVGHGQLHPSIEQDPRVVSFEGLHARDLDTAELPHEHYPIIVIDVSFISLIKILKPVWERLAPQGQLIALIKPQFEVGSELLGKGGIVRDESARTIALENILNYARQELCAQDIRWIDSPIQGSSGNHEYLAIFQKA